MSFENGRRKVGRIIMLCLVLCLAVSLVSAPASAKTVVPSLSCITAGGDRGSSDPEVSADGSTVVFLSSATNLAGGVSGGVTNVYLWNKKDGLTCITSDENGVGANGYCYEPHVSADGSTVVFHSFATNLAGGIAGGSLNVYVWNKDTGIKCLTEVSPGQGANSYSSDTHISDDGSTVTFFSYATDLAGGISGSFGTSYVWSEDMGLKCLTQIGPGLGANSAATSTVLSKDGSTVVFKSRATNLLPGVTNDKDNIYIWNKSGTLECITTGANGDGSFPVLSADGTSVAFQSNATNLVGGITSGKVNVYLWKRGAGITCLSPGQNNTGADETTWYPQISDDGKVVMFVSYATNLIPGINGRANPNLYLWDGSGLTCITKGINGGGANNTTHYVKLAGDGKTVVYSSQATNLVNGVGGPENIYVWDGERISSLTAGVDGTGSDGTSSHPHTSPDGETIAFDSDASNILPGMDGNQESHVYVYYKTTYYDVTFDPQNAHAATTGQVESGDAATEPVAPAKEGYRFLGWYTDPTAGDAWDFSSPVTKDMTLYAHFEEEKNEPPVDPSDDETPTPSVPTTPTPTPSVPATQTPADHTPTPGRKAPEGTGKLKAAKPSSSVATGDGSSYAAAIVLLAASGLTVAGLKRRRTIE